MALAIGLPAATTKMTKATATQSSGSAKISMSSATLPQRTVDRRLQLRRRDRDVRDLGQDRARDLGTDRGKIAERAGLRGGDAGLGRLGPLGELGREGGLALAGLGGDGGRRLACLGLGLGTGIRHRLLIG